MKTQLTLAALALSLCAMPAMAEDAAGATTTTPPQDVWTQDTGSITIHKYEWNGENGGAGTGEAGDSLPSKPVEGGEDETPTPLAGATFTVYQVKNEEDLKDYYDGKNVTWPTSWDEYAEPDTTTGGYKLKNNAQAILVGSKKTNASGVVQFGKVAGEDGNMETLPLCLYLVLETETPDSVKTA